MSIASGKECILQLVEKLDGIVASDGSMLTSELSSELQCYTNLQQTDHKVACKVRLSPKFDLEHVQEHPQCTVSQNGPVQEIGSDKFANHSACPPQSGRLTIAKYFYEVDEQV